MLDKLELWASSTPPKTTDKAITVPTSQTGLSIKIQNDDSSDKAKVNFVLNQVTDPCALAKETATPPRDNLPKDTVVATPMELPVSGAPLPKAAVEAVERSAPGPVAAHPAPAAVKPPGAAAGSPPAGVAPSVTPPIPPPVSPKKKATKEPADEPWETFCKDETKVKIVPRSPEAIVFYLGQLIEAEYPEHGSPFIAHVRGVTASRPLFDVRKGGSGDAGRPEVSVSLDGETYYIPQGPAFESTMHTLTLATQVIGLQKKGTQIPGIVPVQVINP
jgi:hypothetical protein